MSSSINPGKINFQLSFRASDVFCLFLIHHTGSPLQFYVDAMTIGQVTAYGPGLCHGTVNKPATFTVVTKNAGEGNLIINPSLTLTYVRPVSVAEKNTMFVIFCQLLCPLRWSFLGCGRTFKGRDHLQGQQRWNMHCVLLAHGAR